MIDRLVSNNAMTILAAALLAVTFSANAGAILKDVSLAHRFGLEMHEFLDGCLIEMKVYHDIVHPDCKAFNRAARIYMEAREKVVQYAIKRGIIKQNSSALEQIAAIGVVADTEPAYGALVGWEALDRYLDRVQLLD